MTRLPRFSDQVRRAVLECGLTRYRLSKLLGCSQALLGEFVRGRRGLSTPMLDKLGALLNLRVTMDGPSARVLAMARRRSRRK
jgi:transcriptional regulator with XRE-family HTH domain